MNDMYGTIDLTKLGDIIRAHPELVKEVAMKSDGGKVHKFININIYSKEQDKYGNIAYLKVPCKQDNRKLENSKYYLADLKERPDPNANHTGGAKFNKREDYIPPADGGKDDLPF